MATVDRAALITDMLFKLAELIAEPAMSGPPQAQAIKRSVLLTVSEVAEMLGIGRTTTYALVRSGEIESILIGRLRRIHIDSVNAYAARLVERSRAA